MTISKRDAKLLLILLGIIVLLVCYLAVYSPYTTRADSVRSETEALRPTLEQLQSYSQNLDAYKADTETAKTAIADALTRYPTDVRQEDLIMYTVDMADRTGLSVDSISTDTPAALLQFTENTENADGTLTPRTLTAFTRSATLSCSMTYSALKSMIDYISTSALRTALDSVTVSYDSETAGLTGTVTFDKYFITGDGDTYTATDVPSTALGRDNLFGTLTPAATGTDETAG